ISSGFLGVVRGALLSFAVIALLVAAFSIQNTFNILDTQRSRESALLRAIGASRRQIIGANGIETLAVGVIGSAAGWFVGVGIAGVVAAAGGSGGAGLAAFGSVLTVVGAVILGPVAARPVVAVLGAPVAALRGVTGRLSRQNARRNPRRTAATASALMVGVSVV